MTKTFRPIVTDAHEPAWTTGCDLTPGCGLAPRCDLTPGPTPVLEGIGTSTSGKDGTSAGAGAWAMGFSGLVETAPELAVRKTSRSAIPNPSPRYKCLQIDLGLRIVSLQKTTLLIRRPLQRENPKSRGK